MRPYDLPRYHCPRYVQHRYGESLQLDPYYDVQREADPNGIRWMDEVMDSLVGVRAFRQLCARISYTHPTWNEDRVKQEAWLCVEQTYGSEKAGQDEGQAGKKDEAA